MPKFLSANVLMLFHTFQEDDVSPVNRQVIGISTQIFVSHVLPTLITTILLINVLHAQSMLQFGMEQIVSVVQLELILTYPQDNVFHAPLGLSLM